MWFNAIFIILLRSVKPLSPVPEETETVNKADKDLNSLLLEHGLADAMSVSTYHTHTQPATEPVEVRNNIIHVHVYNKCFLTHSLTTNKVNGNYKG